MKLPSNKREIVILLAIILLTALFAQTRTAVAETSTTFSIIWITDTQYLSESHPAYYDKLCQWIVQNRDTYNMKMVIHTGDIVNDEGNRSQWLNANTSMSILLNNDIPYTWDAGNHDFNVTYWMGNQFVAFNPEVMQTKPFWVSEKFGGMNTAVRFNASGYEWLVVNIAFEANESVLAWANSILDANPQSHAIVATHAYLNKAGGYDSWATNFKITVLDTHANVFLTLNGHYYPTSGVRARVDERHELLFNQQDTYDKLGAASARLLTFDTVSRTVRVQTYSVYLNQFIDDPDNDFTLQTSFRNNVVAGSFPTVFVTEVLVVAFFLAVLGLVAFKRKRKLEVF